MYVITKCPSAKPVPPKPETFQFKDFKPERIYTPTKADLYNRIFLIRTVNGTIFFNRELGVLEVVSNSGYPAWAGYDFEEVKDAQVTFCIQLKGE